MTSCPGLKWAITLYDLNPIQLITLNCYWLWLQELEKSREIFLRIRRRKLYKSVDFKALPYEYRDIVKGITEERIAEAARKQSPETTLTADHIIVNTNIMHYGMVEKNPVDSIKFYSKTSPNSEPDV